MRTLYLFYALFFLLLIAATSSCSHRYRPGLDPDPNVTNIYSHFCLLPDNICMFQHTDVIPMTTELIFLPPWHTKYQLQLKEEDVYRGNTLCTQSSFFTGNYRLVSENYDAVTTNKGWKFLY